MPDVGITGDSSAVAMVVVDQPAVYGVGGIDILIVVSCDVQAIIPTVVVQTVTSQDIVLRGLYEHAMMIDCVADRAVCDVDIS